MSRISIILPYFSRKKYLKASLRSFNIFYRGCDLEIVLIDDGSPQEERIENLVKEFPELNIQLVRLTTKTGTNPCLPYNIGVRHSTGDVLVFSSPETIHTASLFKLASNFKDLAPNQLYCFSVFCPTRPETNDLALMCQYDSQLSFLRERVETRAYSGLGTDNREPFASDYGSWYLHSKHRKTELNFLTAMRRETFYELSGFDERFRFGTGYDDTEFRDRLVAKIGLDRIQYFDQALALHLNHTPVYGSGNPVSNQALFDRLKSGQEPAYQPNDQWGRI